MHWFHQVGDMGWLAVFWAVSFLVLFGASWLFTSWPPRRGPRVPRASQPLMPSPRPSA